MSPTEQSEEDDVEVVPMELPLDRATIAWLARLHNLTGDHPRIMIASMLRMIRTDDEALHSKPKRKRAKPNGENRHGEASSRRLH